MIAQADRLKKDRDSHEIGWPHFDRKGNCLCTCKFCFGTAGCICKTRCQGHNHANCEHAHICKETEWCGLSGNGHAVSANTARSATSRKTASVRNAGKDSKQKMSACPTCGSQMRTFGGVEKCVNYKAHARVEGDRKHQRKDGRTPKKPKKDK